MKRRESRGSRSENGGWMGSGRAAGCQESLPGSVVGRKGINDPAGKEPDGFFFTTEVEAYGPAVVSRYAGRWAIEDTFRNTKQCLGGEDPQAWKGRGPERAACLSLWIYAAVWYWYIRTQGARPTFLRTPWYPGKTTPSFADALAALRRLLWVRRIFHRSDSGPLPRKFAAILIGALAEAT